MSKPPKSANRFLSWFCRDELLEEIRGDLQEYYWLLLEEHGKRKAWRLYWLHVLHFLRPFAMKKRNATSRMLIMPKSHLKIAFRRLSKHKVHSAINVFGLSLGITAFMLIMFFVKDELSYDNFHEKPEQVFRIGVSLEIAGQIYEEASIQFPAAEALRQEYPEVTSAVRVYKNGNSPFLQYGDEKYKEDKLFFVDRDFFEVFGYELAAGNIQTALNEPGSILLTETMAVKYFGNENPIGKELQYQGERNLLVTGVVKKAGLNSHLDFDFLMPMAFQLNAWERVSGQNGREKKWFWTGAWTYLRLEEQANADALAAKLPEFIDRHFPDRYKKGAEFIIQPIESIHLESQLGNEAGTNGHKTYIIIFAVVAAVVLLIACINFVNLNTIQALNRIKEIGTRKAIGAGKAHLRSLVISESILVTTLAALTAIALMAWLLPVFNNLTDKSYTLSMLLASDNLMVLMGIILAIAVLSGIYPLVIVSHFHTVNILKGISRQGGGSSMVRKVLVTVQFVASITLIISILIIDRQLTYLNEKDMGYDAENLLVLSARQGVNRQFEAFKEELLSHSHVTEVTGASLIPGYGAGGWRFVPEEGSKDNPVMLPLLHTGMDFTQTMGIKVVEGRDFDLNSPTDRQQAFILNKSAVKELGWEGEAIGKKLEHFGPGVNTIAKSGFVIGVVDDFHFESLHHDLRPMVFTYGTRYNFYLLKISGNTLNEVVSHAENKWAQFENKWPMEYFLLESDLQSHYANEAKLSQTIRYFALVAILIACIGLYAMGAYLVINRIREISIRKILGAKTSQIFLLVNKDFLKMILLANLLAWPVAFLFVNDWLSNFAYRTTVHPVYFVIAGLVSVALVLFTTGYHANKVNRVDLTQSLRNE